MNETDGASWLICVWLHLHLGIKSDMQVFLFKPHGPAKLAALFHQTIVEV